MKLLPAHLAVVAAFTLSLVAGRPAFAAEVAPQPTTLDCEHAELWSVGPESRGSGPIRIDRDPHTLESPGVGGLYPIGEGAGFAGGIVSAAVDGLRAARAIMRKHCPA